MTPTEFVCPVCHVAPSLATPVLANCTPFGQLVLGVGAVVSVLGCLVLLVQAVVSACEAKWMEALLMYPFFFVLQAAVFVVFVRVRALGNPR